MTSQPVHLWIRAEVKSQEHRVPITPEIVKKLLDTGFKITVEKQHDRCVADAEYEKVGCTMVEGGTWRTAPSDAYIFGLKELPENDDSPLTHTHIYFGHCFKYQTGWKDLLARFRNGKGVLLDLEFLQDSVGRRVAAFGYMAGYTGTAVGIDVWCNQKLGSGALEKVNAPYPDADALKKYLKERIDAAVEKGAVLPRVAVIGALGRCGRGACDFATEVGIPEDNIVRWDMNETKGGGPFPQLLDVDILVNCIYLTEKIPPFITTDMLKETSETRKLSVLVDVSCDYTSENNPVPVYTEGTTFSNPTVVVPDVGKVMEVVAIDHLPTLLPKESSERFGADLLPTLLALPQVKEDEVWCRARKLFDDKLAEAEK
ncbi:saccharopine dehydrogenase [NAD+, L-lysine-forming] [Sphaeroforma arctica JP610]|uniref:Saccharopine dehydrogenase [NAD(+), L-lysine-forming] n=1 Tax=Sphaeroforma arctica JP610 TaxID=667725 RepID=A0A0L0G6G1_9EUKA|nr:saccharopine dehydrogenase [NAD+, L-lysine-forming] [Sphaeroforma arctica JP610]KNC83818.1 saccharopine dehydrogenase [NAD+, L-lysine-forming] [Sphaeroforma arctica JP610]|eukprot:XP_014157720.1 saccharopine dehydrogenase [NAD+, L-lysine-forming] [Sphaeroforma arctica JP610]